MPRLRKAWPSVDLDLFELDARNKEGALLDGTVTAALSRPPHGQPRSPSSGQHAVAC